MTSSRATFIFVILGASLDLLDAWRLPSAAILVLFVLPLEKFARAALKSLPFIERKRIQNKKKQTMSKKTKNERRKKEGRRRRRIKKCQK